MMASCYSYLSPALRVPLITKLFPLRAKAVTPQVGGSKRLYTTGFSWPGLALSNVPVASKIWSFQSNPTVLSMQRQTILQPSPLSWSICRTYAKKGKDKGKDKGGKGHKKMTLTSEQLEGLVNMEKVRHDFDHILGDLREKFIHQLTVRTSQGVFDQLTVKTPDGNFPLIQLGQVIQKSPQLLTIDMAPSPQYIAQVKQALNDSGLNVNPQQDGTSLFIALPKVTREHRENLAKNAKMVSEQSKKSLRDVYSKHSRKIKGAKQGHSQDDVIAADDMVKDLMHAMLHQVEEMTAAKQKELLGGK